MIRVAFIFFLALMCASCAIINYDRTSDPEMTPLINHSYVINKDAFLLENRCLNEYNTPHCLYLQVADGSIEVFRGIGNKTVHLPKSFEDYERNKDAYEDSLRDNNIFHGSRYSIVAEIPKGTIIKITKLVSIAMGEDGRGWVVFGEIESQGRDTSIQIGGNSHNNSRGSPPWFKSQDSGQNYYLPPLPLPEFLLPSDVAQ